MPTGKYWSGASGPLAGTRERTLSSDLVQEVRRLRAEGLSRHAITRVCGITQSLISGILRGKVGAAVA
jgi:predicted transcriptional regulator